MASHVVPVVKNPPANTEDIRDVGLILGWEDPLDSSILAWRILWTEEPGGLQSTGHMQLNDLHTHAHIYVYSFSNSVHVY